MSDYLTLCQKMIRDLGMSNSISTVVGQTGMNQKIANWIADADEFIQTKWQNWNFLHSTHSVNTIASTREYSAPSDLGSWDRGSFYLDYSTDNYQHLNEIEYETWRDVHGPGTHTNDKPDSFIILPSGNIYLDPIPDAVYALTADYWTIPTRFSANTDESAIPARFERIILARAKIYYAEHEEFPNVYELAVAEFTDLMRKLEAAELPGKQHATGRSRNRDIDLVIRPR
jgi:hypothetical protein